MISAARVTDAVTYFQKKGEPRGAVRVVRNRNPERFRWRRAVASLTHTAGRLVGMDRMRIEEPVREVVIEVPDQMLRRSIVLDARVRGVDLDRGEVLPRRNYAELRRAAFLAGTDLQKLQRHMPLPVDVFGPVDAVAAVLVSAAIANQHQHQAATLWNRLPGSTTPVALSRHHRRIAKRADFEASEARRWKAFAQALMEPN